MVTTDWPTDWKSLSERRKAKAQVRRERIDAVLDELAGGGDPGQVVRFSETGCMPLEVLRQFRNDPRWAYDARRQRFVALGAEVTDPESSAPVAGSWMRTDRDSRKAGFLCLYHPGIKSRIIVRLPDEEGGNA